jgi:hypothetical protein
MTPIVRFVLLLLALLAALVFMFAGFDVLIDTDHPFGWLGLWAVLFTAAALSWPPTTRRDR